MLVHALAALRASALLLGMTDAPAQESGAGAGARREQGITAVGSIVPRRLEERFADVTNVLDFIPASLHEGIRANTNRTDLTHYITTALASRGSGTLLFPAGTYHHTALAISRALNVVGVGWADTILVNTNPRAASITVNSQPGLKFPFIPTGVRIEDLRISGGGDGIVYDTQSHSTIRRVHIRYVGGHGIRIASTQHAYGLTVDNSFIEGVRGDGVFGKASWTRQVNAINIVNGTEIQGCHGSGVNLWGIGINIKNSIIENNHRYGVLLSEADLLDRPNTAANVSIEGNYVEANKAGNLRVEVGQYSRTIAKSVTGLSIRGNYLHGGTMNAGAKNVSFVRVASAGDAAADAQGYVVGLVFTGNTLALSAAAPENASACDFGDAVGSNSIIAPADAAGADLDETAPDSIEARYLNMGAARFVPPTRRLTLPGAFLARGDIRYSDPMAAHSEVIAASAAPQHAYFPVLVPQGSLLLGAAVHVEEIVAGTYDVSIEFLQRDPRGPIGAWSRGASFRADRQTGSKLIDMPRESLREAARSGRVPKGKEDLLLRITLTGTPGTRLRLGNPIIRYN